MKALFIHENSENISGQEIALLNTIKSISKHGISSIVLLSERGRLGNFLLKNNVEVMHCKLSRLSKSNPFPYLKTVFSLFILIKKVHIKIVSASGAYPTQYCLPAARLAGIPCVTYVHNTIYSAYDIKRSFVNRSDCIIAVSDAVNKMLVRNGCSAQKTKTIYCGVFDEQKKYSINSTAHLRNKFEVPQNYKIIGQIGQIIPRKGLEYFIQMAAAIKKQQVKVKFMIIGEAPPEYQEYEKEVKNIVVANGLEADVIFTGFTDKVDEFIDLLDIVVLASIAEGLPFSVVEAQLREKPVVATAVGGISEIIENGKTGLLVPPSDHESLTKAVFDLIANEDKAKKIGLNGRKTVLDKFSFYAHGHSIAKLFSSLTRINNERRILFFESSSGYGGSASALVNLINNLNRQKYLPVVAYTNAGTQLKMIKEFRLIKIDGYVEPERMSSIQYALDFILILLPEALKLFLIIKKGNIKILHNNTNVLLGIPAIISAKLAGIPIVCHVRETREITKREKYFAKLVDKFVVLNKVALEIYKQHVPERKISLIYDGVNMNASKVTNRKNNLKRDFNLNGSPVVGLIGRIVEGKGQGEFIRVAQEVTKIKPEVKFLIVGEAKGGTNNYYRKINDLVKKEKLVNNVIFTGWRTDIREVISELDIVILASTTFPEGLPNVVIEASALGKPVVVTDIPGPPEIIEDGKTGFIVPPADIKAMSDKIIYLLNNPDIAKKMGEAGRKRCEEVFNIKNTVRQIENIYEELLNK